MNRSFDSGRVRFVYVVAIVFVTLLLAIAISCSEPATTTRELVGPVTAKIPATDSASAATAWATGEKTTDGMLSWKYDGSGALTNIVDILKKHVLSPLHLLPFLDHGNRDMFPEQKTR